jgi:hypothetical protein
MTIATENKQIGFEEFCEELRVVADYYRWECNSETLSIRGKMRDRMFCPITAVAFSLYGKYYRVNRWADAAAHIGLPYWIANNIAQAADSGVLFNGELEDFYRDLLWSVKK